MSQADVYKFLKKNKGKCFSARDIYNKAKLNIQITSITKNLSKLKHDRFVKFKRDKDLNVKNHNKINYYWV